MGRETSPFIIGDYWLDKRRDGKSPDIWQIATYSPKSRSVVYRSTKRRALEDAKPILRSHEATERARQAQSAEDAELVPQLFNYYREHGQNAKSPDTIASSIRSWIGFLDQDVLTTSAKVNDMRRAAIERFIKWRKGAHGYKIEWGGRIYEHSSKGVTGETIQRNIEDLRAALNFAEDMELIPFVPKIRSVAKEDRSPARKTRLTIEQMGAVFGYAKQDKDVYQWLCLMLGTTVRPEAAMAFRPSEQWDDELIDLHPPEWDRTKKVNPVVPAIEPLKAMLYKWEAFPAVKSHGRWWRSMRVALDLPTNIIPKTIRHTVATELRKQGVPGGELSGLLGHADPDMRRTSAVYAHYDPKYLAQAKAALTTFWDEVMASADKWGADHLRTKQGNKRNIVVDNTAENRQKYLIK